MPINGVAPTAAAASTGPAAAAQTAGSPLGGLGSDGFLKLLVAQLRYQNPMEPTDTTAMMAQTSQLAQVDTLNQVAATQRQMLGFHQASVAAGLVGMNVTALTADGSTVEGVVSAVRFSDLGPVLRIGDTDVALDAALEIRHPSTAPAPTQP